MKKVSKIILIISFIFLFNNLVYANSAPTYWTDYPSTGVMAVNKNTPIRVLKEDLLFDFSVDYERSYSPSAKVTAIYQMENTSGESISEEMAFPFIERFNSLAADDIVIKADDNNISYKLYMGDIVQEAGYPFQEPKNTDYNIDKILSSITEKKYLASNFKENELGKLYTFNVSSPKNINFAVSFNFDPEKTKIIMNGFNRFERDNDNNIRIASSVGEDRPLEMYVLGDDIDLDFKAYTDGSLKEEIDKFDYEIITEEKDIEVYLSEFTDYYLENYAGNYDNMTSNHISVVSLYNLYAQALDEYLDRNLGICSESDIMSQIRSPRIMILVYNVEFPQNSTKEVSISYKTNGTMDRRETVDPRYIYKYILTPAKYWKDFKNLNIKINTPEEAPYIIDSSIELKKEDNNVYTAYLGELPDEDFSFTLYSKEKVTISDKVGGYLNRKFGYFTPIVIGFVVIVICFVIIYVIIKNYKRKV